MKTQKIFAPTIYNGKSIYIESTEALCARVKYYFRRWEAQRRNDGCAHPNQPLTSRVCWLQDKLLQRFKCGEQLPCEILQYLIGYRIVNCILLGRKYII